jgi:hypothetical protein
MYQYDPGFARQLHAERMAALRADYAQRVEQPRPEPRVKRMNRPIRLAWVSDRSRCRRDQSWSVIQREPPGPLQARAGWSSPATLSAARRTLPS